MDQALLAGLITVGGTAIVGAALAVFAADLPWSVARTIGLSSWVLTARKSREQVTEQLGRVPAFAAVIAFGIGVVMLVGYPLGVAARMSQPVDDRVLAWALEHEVGWLTSVMDVVTQMGNRSVTKPVTLAAILVLVLIRTRRRWVPVVAFLAAYTLEFYFQHILEAAINRPDPPTAGGNYPSGGCARLVLTYGLLVWFLLRERRGPVSRAEFVGWWSFILAAGVLEAFSRTYLVKHWVSDTVGGLVFGGLLLLALASASAALDRPGPLFGADGGRHRTEPEPAHDLVPTEG